MEKLEMKEELINRYKYLYENALYILAPYIYQNERKAIYMDKLPANLLLSLESFLLSDIPFNVSALYQELEKNKENPSYLARVKEGLSLQKKANEQIKNSLHINLWNLLFAVREFINEQSGDIKNKEKKLEALNEYFRIKKYMNDGNIWTGSFFIDYPKELTRPKKDVGQKSSKFINYLVNPINRYNDNNSILTEQEKQDIYLSYHDELPWNLVTTCEKDDGYQRPDNTNPCGEVFYIKEEEIFMANGQYYQLCPNCGYIVNIPSKIFTDSIKERINKRCIEDPNLMRKMYLYSELISLDKMSSKGQRKMLKKNNR